MRDRLDGSSKRNLFFEVFTFPGRLVLWLLYMFPKGKYAAVRMTSRHARSPLMTIFYSLLFWFCLYAVGTPIAINKMAELRNDISYCNLKDALYPDFLVHFHDLPLISTNTKYCTN